jgi:hypothetical protein
VVEPNKSYAVIDLGTGKITHHSGQALADGLPIRLTPRHAPLSLVISER